MESGMTSDPYKPGRAVSDLGGAAMAGASITTPLTSCTCNISKERKKKKERRCHISRVFEHQPKQFKCKIRGKLTALHHAHFVALA